MPNATLSAEDCKLVEQHADDKITLYNKQNDILGEQIFDILKRNCRVLLYPLDDDDVWGFYEKIDGHSFICINTSIDIDKQVFVAAHELYHLWYNHPEELILAADIEERDQNLSIEEKKANRFAAAFLVPEMLLGRVIGASGIDVSNIDVQDIVKLARSFLVPYRTMVKRLCEIGKIRNEKCAEFLNITEEQIDIWRKRLGLELVRRTNDVSLDVLVDKAISAFERRQITRAKLEYLLSLASTTPGELGIPDEEPYVPPTEDDLREMMED